MQDSIKGPYLQITGLAYGGETQVNGTDQIFNKIKEGIFHKSRKDIAHTDKKNKQRESIRSEKKICIEYQH